MGEMSLHKDWLNTNNRGDTYPLTAKFGDVCEKVAHEKYEISFVGSGLVRRMLFSYFPWFSYDVDFESLSGDVGFTVTSPIGYATVTFNKNGCVKITTPKQSCEKICDGMTCGTISVAFRGKGVSVYSIKGSEQTLLNLAYSYENATNHRVPSPLAPNLCRYDITDAQRYLSILDKINNGLFV